MDVIETIRQAIRDCPQSLRQIARDTGLDASQLSLFVRGKRNMNLETASRLCAFLGLELQRGRDRCTAT